MGILIWCNTFSILEVTEIDRRKFCILLLHINKFLDARHFTCYYVSSQFLDGILYKVLVLFHNVA